MFGLAATIEDAAARWQGKGSGALSVRSEVHQGVALLGRDPRIVLDIGANVGEYTAAMLAKSHTAEIHLFEPSTANVENLRIRYARENRVTVIDAAVSDTNGQETLWADVPGSVLGSLTRRRLDHFGIEFSQIQAVTTIRIEDYWRKVLNCCPIDIAKLDIEGHELRALEGFGEALSQVEVLQFEFGGCNIDARTYFQDFWYFLTKAGFLLYRVTPIGLQEISCYSEKDEAFVTTNYIGRRACR